MCWQMEVEKFFTAVKQMLGAGVEIAKRNELHTFKVIPKRWKGLLLGWKNAGDCGKRKINTSLHMVLLAFITILFKTF